MKRRNWLWFGASGILALGAGVLAILILVQVGPGGRAEPTPMPQFVVVAANPIGIQSAIRTDNVAVEDRGEVPSGAMRTVPEVVGKIAKRDIAAGEVILQQDLETITDTMEIDLKLEDDEIAVAVPADDILSAWGAVVEGMHVDALFTVDLILETPMYPEETITLQEGETLQRIDRDQSFDNVSVLTVQDMEVLRIIQEPAPQGGEEGQPVTQRRALVLKVDPQDAVVIKYLLDSTGKIDLALRARDNGTLFDVDSVNINYLLLRYGMALPEQPE